MNFLEMRTVVFLMLITYAICTMLLAQLWLQNRRVYAGTGFWALDAGCQTLGIGMLVLRGTIPDWLSLCTVTPLVIFGSFLGYLGLERFLGKRGPQLHNGILLAAFAAGLGYGIFIDPDLAFRNCLFSATLLAICLQCLWLMLRRADPGMRRLTSGVWPIFVGLSLVCAFRIASHFAAASHNDDYFQSGTFEKSALITYLFLFVLLTYNLSLMLNRRLQEEIQAQREKFAKVFQFSANGILLSRASDGQVLDVNDGFTRLTGYSPAEVLGKSVQELNLSPDPGTCTAILDELAAGQRIQGLETKFLTKDGEVRTGLCSAEIIDIGQQPCLLTVFSDITDRKNAEERIRHMAQHDPLTDLPNRALFDDLLAGALAAARRDQGRLALLFIDVDNLKTVNDSAGHAFGDRLLQVTAWRLRQAIRESDTAARFGGDEFVVLLRQVRGAEDARLVAEKIQQAIREPFEAEEKSISASACIGISVYPEHGAEPILLLKHADDAMYLAKAGGRNCIRLYQPLGG